jgi:hypothetical protein
LLANANLRNAALAYPAVLGAILLAAGGFGVGLSAQSEPLPSPVSISQARELRDLALAIRAAEGGSIVVHIDLIEDVTWPFRDSGDIVVSSFVPEDAVIVIWLPGLPQPEGYLPVSGAWALSEAFPAPGDSWLDWVEWLGDRNSTTSVRQDVAVYIRANP